MKIDFRSIGRGDIVYLPPHDEEYEVVSKVTRPLKYLILRGAGNEKFVLDEIGCLHHYVGEN